MNSPRNTSKSDPMENLLAAMGGIEAQEAQGQRELVASAVLPFPGWNSSDADFEALGFTFGDKVPGDDLFREATLPPGWTRKGTEHAMHTDVLDERGIARVGVFYKAAFYDRRADMHIINVGGRAAQQWIYGDDEELTLHPGLTAEELADAKAGAEAYLVSAEEHPDIYADRLPRAEALLKRLAEVKKS
ncbi:MAG TPA: hypothetical protein VIP58_17045 [Nocardioides sp.]